MSEPLRDCRIEQQDDFRYGTRESPDHIEYIPPVYIILDMYFETIPGTADALRLVQLAKDTLWTPLEVVTSHG